MQRGQRTRQREDVGDELSGLRIGVCECRRMLEHREALHLLHGEVASGPTVLEVCGGGECPGSAGYVEGFGKEFECQPGEIL